MNAETGFGYAREGCLSPHNMSYWKGEDYVVTVSYTHLDVYKRQRKLHEGGVCGTMSLISRNSQIARGIPAAPAGTNW